MALRLVRVEHNMSRVQGRDSDVSNLRSSANLRERCDVCKSVSSCNVCGSSISGFEHIGVRAVAGRESGIWHYASPCRHRNQLLATSANVKYGGGPLWKNGYTKTYSGGLSQYNVGIGKVSPLVKVQASPAAKISDAQIKQTLTGWIASGTVPNLGGRGAYNIFLPPGVIVSLTPLEASCAVFCDYHNTVNGSSGPFYTVEPYPCSNGCNQCTNNPLDTLTQGLSEELVELKTDMNPGTGWVIGNLELCDYCDAKFVCNRIGGGEYVNSWYDKSKKACWKGI